MATVNELTSVNFIQWIKSMDEAESNKITKKKLIDLILAFPEPDQRIAALENNLQAFKTILDHVNILSTQNKAEIDALKNINEELKQENLRLRTQVTSLNEKDNDKETRLQSLQTQVNEIEQYLRINNLEIVGLPPPIVADGETDEDVIITACNSLAGIDDLITPEDIDISHPLNSRRKDGKPVHIVRFVSRKKKLMVLAAKKQLENRQFKFRTKDVYINEHLNKPNRSIFAAATERKRTLNYKHLWTKNEVVHMRKTDDSDMAISSSEYLLNIESTWLKDQLLEEILSSLPKNILNLDCEDIPVDEDDDNIDIQRISDSEEKDILQPIALNTRERSEEEILLKERCFSQTREDLSSSDFDQTVKTVFKNDQKCPDSVEASSVEDLGFHFVDLGCSLMLHNTCNPFDDDPALSLLSYLDDTKQDVVNDSSSLVDEIIDTSTKVNTPTNLHSKSNQKTQKKVVIGDNGQRFDKVPRISEKSLTKPKYRKARDKPNNCYHLYDFIGELLSGKICPGNPRCVEWVDEEKGEFRIVNTVDFARFWGQIKASKSQKPTKKTSTMTYEKVSRTLRYYCGYNLKILEKVEGKKCHFRFGTRNTWSKKKI